MSHWFAMSRAREVQQGENARRARERKDLFVKWIATLITFVIFFIPSWFWLAVYFLAGPTGFWQKFAVLGLGTILVGGLQFALFLVWIGILINVIWD